MADSQCQYGGQWRNGCFSPSCAKWTSSSYENSPMPEPAPHHACDPRMGIRQYQYGQPQYQCGYSSHSHPSVVWGSTLVCILANISMQDVSMISQHEATPSWHVQSHINSFINVTLRAFFQKCTHAPCWYVLTTKDSPCAEFSLSHTD